MIETQVISELPDYLVLTAPESTFRNVVMKLAGPTAARPSSFARTAALHRLVAQSTSLVMPETIAVDETCRVWPWRYFIRTHLDGSAWGDVQRNQPARTGSAAG